MSNALVIHTPEQSALVLRAEHLMRKAKDYRGHRRASNTLTAYRYAWEDFTVFCQDFGVSPLPASPAAVAAYLTQCADEQTLSTLRVKMAAISHYHREARREQQERFPELDEAELIEDPTLSASVSDVMDGIARDLGLAQEGKAAVSQEELFEMVRAIHARPTRHEGDALRNRRDGLILLLGFAGAFRRSELTHLKVDDIAFDWLRDNGRRRQVAFVTLRRSKTDQEGKGFLKVIPSMTGDLCPVRELKLWLKEAEIVEGPVFRKINKGHHVEDRALTPQVVAQIVQQAAELAGLEAGNKGGHTLRASWVTEAFERGLSTEEIMSVTGHKTPGMVLRYNREKERLQARAIRKVLQGD